MVGWLGWFKCCLNFFKFLSGGWLIGARKFNVLGGWFVGLVRLVSWWLVGSLNVCLIECDGWFVEYYCGWLAGSLNCHIVVDACEWWLSL